MADPILIAKSDRDEIYLLPRLANRHGLIAGATGIGLEHRSKRIAGRV